jgi:hypothetical protein
MPDKCMLCIDNIGELSRDSRLTREVPFFSLGSRAKDSIHMAQQQCRRGGKFTPGMTNSGRYAAVVLLAVLSAACATLTPDSPNDEKVKVVMQRAEARWKAIIGKDFAAAYEYMSPATRATVTPAGFKTVASRIDYQGIKVTGATCDGGTCRVKLILTYNAGAAYSSAVATKGNESAVIKGINTPLEENWVIDKGQIWYVWPI